MFIEIDHVAMDAVNPPDPGNARPVPLYEHVKRQMSEAILLGEWPPGTTMPGEIALAARYGVAVGTMRRALSDLTAEGLLVRRRKTGTAVTGRSPHHSLRHFFQYFRLHGADGSLLQSKPRMLALDRDAASTEERATFGPIAKDGVIRITRLRCVARRPVMWEQLALPANRLPSFPTRMTAVPDLLYLHLLEQYGIRISAVRESLTAALADAETRRLLRLHAPAAVLRIDDIAYDQAGTATIIGHRKAATAGYCYLNEVR
jgi:GntR family transcriptional regulator